MRRHDPTRWLLGCLLVLALPVLAQTTSSSQATEPSPTPTPSTASAPQATAPAQQAAAPAPPPHLSPEEEGDLMEAQQRYQAAVAAYSKIPHPTAGIWNKMGIANQMLFNSKEALRCYKESIKLNAHSATTMNNLATVYDSMKEYGQAEKIYRKALKVSPKSAIIYKNLGTNLMTQRKYTKGMEAYKEAMTLDPGVFQERNSPRVANPTNVQDRGAMNYYMALGCVRAGQTDCALQYLRNALDEGFITAKKLAADDGFLTLRDNPGFQQLLADQQPPPAQQPQQSPPQKQ